jgi:hypothetical protein
MDEKATSEQVAYRESRERVVRGEIGTEQDAGVLDGSFDQDPLKRGRRRVHDGDRVADEGQRGSNMLEDVGISVGDREMAGLPPRGGTQSRQMNRQSLLQLPRSTRGDQRRARNAAADVDQEAGTIRLGTRAGEGCRGGS